MSEKSSRRDFLKTIGLASISAAALSGCTGIKKFTNKSKVSKPNIVIFLADDLGYGDLGCYGNPINRTPHIDRFASEGIRFTDFHSAGTVCSPARASLLTGRHPYRLGFYYLLGGGAHLKREEITIPSLLNQAGYQTFFAGKWHLTDFNSPEKGQPDPNDHGFDHWFGTVLNAFDGPENPGKFYRNGKPVGQISGWYCDAIVEEAADWLRKKRDKDRPFFLLLSSHEPHTPVAPPEHFADVFDKDTVERLENKIKYGRVPRPKNKDIEANKKFYYGTVAQLDAAFGNLMQNLDEEGLRENTLVLFTSDNGPEYPVNFMESHGRWDDPLRDRCFGTPGPLRGMKRFTHEGGHRVPGIARWPCSIPAGVESDALINGTDLLPTLCELAGISVPTDRTIDGESVTSALKGKPFSRKKPVCWNTPVHEHEFVPAMTMRDKNFILVAWFNDKAPDLLWMDWIKTAHAERYELYDLSQDIGQVENLSKRMPYKVKELAAKMDLLWRDIQTEAPIWPEWKAK